jgi:hypothetical protein
VGEKINLFSVKASTSLKGTKLSRGSLREASQEGGRLVSWGGQKKYI